MRRVADRAAGGGIPSPVRAGRRPAARFVIGIFTRAVALPAPIGSSGRKKIFAQNSLTAASTRRPLRR